MSEINGGIIGDALGLENPATADLDMNNFDIIDVKNLTIDSSDMTLSTTTSGDIVLNSFGDVVIPKVDINSGTIDNTTIGAVTQTTADFTAIGLTAPGSGSFTTGAFTAGLDTNSIGAGSPGTGAFTELNIDNLKLDVNTLSATDANGNINFVPNGTGQSVFGSTIQTESIIPDANTTRSIGASTKIYRYGYFDFLRGNIVYLPSATPLIQSLTASADMVFKTNAAGVKINNGTDDVLTVASDGTISTGVTNGDINIESKTAGTGKIVFTTGNIYEFYNTLGSKILYSYGGNKWVMVSSLTVGSSISTNDKYLIDGIEVIDAARKGIFTALDVSSTIKQTKNTTKSEVIQPLWYGVTANNTPLEIFLDGSSDRLVLDASSSMTFDLLVTARDNVSGDSAGYKLKGVIKRDASSDTVIEGSVITEIIAEGDSTWTVTATADNANEALAITVTGDAANPTQFTCGGTVVKTTF